MLERTVKCSICGRPYKVFAHYAGDQSACRACVRAADAASSRPDTEGEILRRRRFFGS